MTSPRYLALACAAVLLAGCDGAVPGGAATTSPDPEAAVGSYARGLVLGRRAQSAVLDSEAFIAGVRAGIADDDSRYTDDEMQAGLAAIEELEMAVTHTETDANIAAGKAFLASNRDRPEVIETASGLQYEVIVEGEGARPVQTDMVRVHYRGTTLDGETFDASYDRGEPAEFRLNRVIAGWTEGLQLMSVGSKYKLYIPQELAYGSGPQRRGSLFGAGSTLIFEVELLAIVR